LRVKVRESAGGVLRIVLLWWLAALPAAHAAPVAGTYLSIEGIPPEAPVSSAATGEWILYLDGEIDSTAAARLAAFTAEHGIRRAAVYFNSPGGSLVAAMAIGRLLREHGYRTNVGKRTTDPRKPASGVCYSACPFAFAGGLRRSLEPGAFIGVHRASNRVPVPDESAFQQVVSGQATQYLSEMGVSPDLFRIMEGVPPDVIRRITHAEAVQLDLVTDGGVPAGTPPSGAGPISGEIKL
jgi:ATP-dependent protease ClpP protease subunit